MNSKLLGLILMGSAALSASATHTVPELSLSTQCQWLMLRTQDSMGRSTMEVPWLEVYQSLRHHAESSQATSGVLPEMVGNLDSVRKNFGRLSVGHRDQLVRHVVDRSYHNFAVATRELKLAIEELQAESLRRPASSEAVFRAWTRALGVENHAVYKEHQMLAYVNGVQNLLQGLGTPHLQRYRALHLRPEYENHYWHLSPPMAEQMLLMATRGHTEWKFSGHALEQSELRGYSEDLIRKGLQSGKFSVIEARPEPDRRTLDEDVTEESLRFKVNITDFTHEGRPKDLIIIVKFERTPDSAAPFRTTVITTWNQNMRARYKLALENAALTNRISLKNKAFREKFKVASYRLLHDLTYFSIGDEPARQLITSLVKGVGSANARAILRTTLDFIALEMPRAQVGKTMEKVYQDLYSQRL